MNKYQKIALLIGGIVLILLFGKTITQVRIDGDIGSLGALMGKFLVVIIAIVLLISFLEKKGKKKMNKVLLVPKKPDLNNLF